MEIRTEYCSSVTRLRMEEMLRTSASEKVIGPNRLEELQKLMTAAVASISTAWHHRQPKQLAIEKITQISRLTENWDGEGAIEIAPKAIELASALLRSLPDVFSTPDVSPNPNGTLSLYWALPHGSAELEIGRTRHSWVLLNQDGCATQTCSGDNRAFEHDPAIQDLIRALAPRQFGDGGTPPITNLKMLSSWNEFLEAF